MYSYIHDPETGGLLLTDTPSIASKEPRPVYASELDLLGFDEFWDYEKQDDIPYMWAEANYYFYRGKRVAKIFGGNLFTKPEISLELDECNNYILPVGYTLNKIDIQLMINKNKLMLDTIEKLTKKRIYKYYNTNKNKYDYYRISFSGGKDSIVLLDIVKNIIPQKNLIVIFCDTDMEFPPTYDLINQIEKQCKQENIIFHRASSHLRAKDTWELFGPPSRILRWCCFVHKSAPLALKMKQIIGSDTYRELVFVGVRASESSLRSKYPFIIKNKKVKSQTTYNAILDWDSAEIWLYIYYKNLVINNAYKIGNQRVGCLYCPMSLKSDYIKYKQYKNEMSIFVDIVSSHFNKEDLINGYWCSRANGILLNDNEQKIFESYDCCNYSIIIKNPCVNINTWIKTISKLDIPFSIIYLENGYKIEVPIEYINKHRTDIVYLKNVIYKTGFCISCGVCESNCVHNCIISKNEIEINKCVQCQGCNTLEYGCVRHHSLRIPNVRGDEKMKITIDLFSTHAPKTEWLEDFFNKGDSFFTNNSLGSEQITRFKKFLNLCNLSYKCKTTNLFNILKGYQWNSEIPLSILLVNLSYCSQIKWYIKNLNSNRVYNKTECIRIMENQGYKPIAIKNVISAFRRFCELPLGSVLNFGYVETISNKSANLCRTKTILPDPRVFLYGLFKFAEACGNYYEIPVSRLMDFSIDSDGVSPSEIFGMDRNETEQYLHGLASNYPDFVRSFTTTHGLEILNLNSDKTSEDVLTLF